MYCEKCGVEIVDGTLCQDCMNANPKSKKKLLIVLAIAILIILIICGVIYYITHPSKERLTEIFVNDIYETIQDDLIDPDSLTILSMELQLYEDGNNGANAYVYYSASNIGGGVSDREALVFVHDDGDNRLSRYYSDEEIEAKEGTSEELSMLAANLSVMSTLELMLENDDVISLSRKEIKELLDD